MKDLYHAEYVVTSNESREILKDAFLLVEKGEILEVGLWKKRPKSKTLKIHDFTFGMITPGLFNLHTHLAMTLLRGVAEDMSLFDWIFKKIFPLEKKWVSRDFVKTGTELAFCELIRNGITTFADMYFYQDEVAKLTEAYGLRGVHGVAIIDQDSPDGKSLNELFDYAEVLLKKYENHSHIYPAVAPHAPYTCSLNTLKRAAELSKRYDALAMIHTAETQKELLDIKKEKVLTPVSFIRSSGLFDVKRLLLPHSVWVEPSDHRLLSAPQISTVINSQCNAKLASGVAPVEDYLKEGVRFVLGSDGAASNNNLDIFEEMNFLAKVHHLTTGHLEGLPCAKLFEAATIRGAEAIGKEKELGSLEPGKRADFIVLDLQSPHLYPLTNIYGHLVFSARGSDVHSTFVNGKCLMRNRKILVTDEKRVLLKAQKFWEKMKHAS